MVKLTDLIMDHGLMMQVIGPRNEVMEAITEERLSYNHGGFLNVEMVKHMLDTETKTTKIAQRILVAIDVFTVVMIGNESEEEEEAPGTSPTPSVPLEMNSTAEVSL